MTFKTRFAVFVSLVTLSAPAFSQQYRVDPSNMYERVLAVVPIVGKGTLSDPRRPMYAPVPSAINSISRTGIAGFTFVTSDDGQSALAEFVARDRSALKDILNDKTIKSFLKGRDKLDDALIEFKKHKKEFDFSKFGVVRVP